MKSERYIYTHAGCSNEDCTVTKTPTGTVGLIYTGLHGWRSACNKFGVKVARKLRNQK